MYDPPTFTMSFCIDYLVWTFGFQVTKKQDRYCYSQMLEQLTRVKSVKPYAVPGCKYHPSEKSHHQKQLIEKQPEKVKKVTLNLLND